MSRWFHPLLAVALLCSSSLVAEEAPVSFHRQVFPILRANCVSCHKPGKSKGQLDLSSHAGLLRGGKDGAAIEAGAPHRSRLFEDVTGEVPAMPEEGEPLTEEEVAVIERWIAQGAKDDTPPGVQLRVLSSPPIYNSAPALSALAWSSDGNLLAVGGFHEVLLHDGSGTELLARLPGHSPRIESLAFSADGKLLAVAGGAPSEYGEIQIWDVASRKLLRSIITTNDTVFGVSFAPDASKVAVGCADKTVRAFSVTEGVEVMKCDNHIDWVFATTFSRDGARLVSASRDRAVKLIDLATGRLIDDVNRPRDVALSLAGNPNEDQIAYGDEKGGVRIYKMEPRGGRLAEGDDKENSYLRECERLPGAVPALAWSRDGNLIAAGCASGEARVFNAADGKRRATLKAGEGAIFVIVFDAEGKRVATGGYDGKVRVFDSNSGDLLSTFTPVPLSPMTAAQ